MKTFTVEFNLSDSEYMTALRLVVGAVCSAADVDVDCSEDMKVCVTESCLVLKDCGYESVKVALGCDGGVTALIEGCGGIAADYDNGFSLSLISALVDTCDILKNDGKISGFKLKL